MLKGNSVLSRLGADAPFTDAASFDSYLSSLIGDTSLSSFRDTYGCPGYNAFTLRYTLSTFCGFYVAVSSVGTNNCNPSGVSASLCRSTGQSFLTSLTGIFSNTTICTAEANQQQLSNRDQLQSSLGNYISALTVDVPDTCVRNITAAAAGEDANCGFQNTAAALAFCSASTAPDACCTQVAGFTTTIRTTTSSVASTTTAAVTTTTTTTVAPRVSSSVAPPLVNNPITSSTAAAAPTTTTTDTATQGAQGSGGSGDTTILGLGLPVFIGAVVGGTVVLVAIIVGVVLCARRRSRTTARAMQPGAGAGYAASGAAAGAYRPKSDYDNEEYNGYRGQQQQQQMSSNLAGGPAGYGGGYGGYEQQQSRGGNAGGRYGGLNNIEISAGSPIGEPLPPTTVSPMPGAAAAAAAAGGAAAIAAASASTPAPQDGGAQIAETMEAIFNYVPNLSDEIYLYVGDPVVVKCQFDDGWGYGFNMTTKQEGAFPLACVAAYGSGAGEQYEGAAETARAEEGGDVNRASFSIKQRGSSMYGPPQGFQFKG
ncbi:hypothetical protein HDU96_000178 [Phlyctochytrium bullatum]|nr:hypothetical protein HDU96_000178 [Phlyctochytrium bullatum]